ncbi:MAG TPA: hypothetical protein PLX80_00140 [Ignavibacteria bacterium]|nr:hypothetical protein [Ignavibacteria bacterium]
MPAVKKTAVKMHGKINLFKGQQHSLSSGVYFYELVSGDFKAVKKLIVLK